MDVFRISEVAMLLGVSDDTVRRLVEAGRLPSVTDRARRRLVRGVDLARFLEDRPAVSGGPFGALLSARNQMLGVITHVQAEPVLGQVELRCGPFRVTAVVATDSIREQHLEPGVLASAVVKATDVIVETRSLDAATRSLPEARPRPPAPNGAPVSRTIR